MKISKKIFAVICSLTMMTSMVGSAFAAETIADPLSLALNENAAENTVVIDIKTTLDTIGGATIYLKVPKAIESYITGWSFSSNIPSTELDAMLPNDSWVDGYTTSGENGYRYIQQSMGTAGTLSSMTIPSDDVFLTATLTLVEGGIPATVSEADRTITLGGDYAGGTGSKKKGASLITTNEKDYYLKSTDTTNLGSKNYFDFDMTAPDNYVVLPTAGGEDDGNDDENTDAVEFKGFAGTDAEGNADGSYAVATKKTFAGVEGANKILWTVDHTDGHLYKYESTVNLNGGADYTLGMVINGLAAEYVKAITAVLQ